MGGMGGMVGMGFYKGGRGLYRAWMKCYMAWMDREYQGDGRMLLSAGEFEKGVKCC